MDTRRLGKTAAALVVVCVCVPALAFGQASITGVVRDASGGVLPGVTVEAASPALLEKVRTTVSDGTGQYRVENLRPGAYTVTFTLAGFATVKREGLELTGNFVATVNAELRVGTLQETITVTADTPLVDVQSTMRQRVMDHEVIDAIPTGRSDKNLAALIPGVYMTGATISQDVGGTQDQVSTQMSVHGSRGGDQRLTQNGVSLGITANGANTLIVATNLSAYQEVTVDTGAVSAEMSTGGVRMNYIPRDGGNTFSGSMSGGFSNGSLQGNNFTDELKATGLGTPDALKKVWDINPSMGGPVMRDRLWFHVAYKKQTSESYRAGIYTNLNANDPSSWTYAPDLNSRPFNAVDGSDLHMRLTWQVLPTLKFGASNQESGYCACTDGVNATTSPEAAVYRSSLKQRNLMGDWTAPLTNRLLIDGAVIHRHQDQLRNVPPQYSNPAMISVTEQALGNLVYRTVNTAGGNPALRSTWFSTLFIRNSVSYITGAHSFKAGFLFGNGNEVNWLGNQMTGAQQVHYRFNNGVPNQITLLGYPLRTVYTTDSDSGAFVQDKWTIRRLTASYGLRFDHFANSAPETVAGPTPLLPRRNIVFPAAEGVTWKDITPKLGAAYDLFGSGKTALKVSLNKYVQGMGSNDPNFGSALVPVNRVGNVTTRAWTDANRDFIPNCDLTSPGANGECGALANQNFGSATPGASYDPAVLSGWGVRSYNWEFSTGIQQQILPRVSMDVSYFRRWYGNFFVVDNRAVSPSDVGAFSVTAPGTDSRLPTSGQVIGGLYNLNNDKVGLVDNYITKASNYGKQSEIWNGLDVTLSARLQNGLLAQGGVSSGRTRTNTCEIRTKLPETALTDPFCAPETPFLTQVKFLAAYTVPRIDVQLSGTLQSIPGPAAGAQFVATNALVQPSLGRPLSGGAANVTVNLIAANTLFIERVNQVDLRVGKILRAGRTRASLNLDIFNALNSGAVLGVNSAFGGTTPWLRPQAILQARLLKVSWTLDF